MIAATADETKEKVLCIYYFKTLMLWACEERAEEFWSEHSLVNAVYTLLIQMTEWLTLKHCPNYFIPANNMLDQLADTDLFSNINALKENILKLNVLVSLITTCKSLENECNLPSQLEAPYCIYTTYLLACQMPYVYGRYNRHNYFDATKYSKELNYVLTLYLHEIFLRMSFNSQARCCNIKTEKETLFAPREESV